MVDADRALSIEVGRHPVIYDFRHKDNKDQVKKEQAWMMIGQALGKDVEDCKHRFSMLRQRYTKELRDQRRGVIDPGFVRFDLFDEMSYLKDFVLPRRRSTNIRRYFEQEGPSTGDLSYSVAGALPPPLKEEDDDVAIHVSYDSDVESVQVPSTTTGTEPEAPPAKVARVEQRDQIDRSVDRSMSIDQYGASDEYELFGLQVAAHLRRFGNHQMISYAKMRIQQVLYEVEFGGTTHST